MYRVKLFMLSVIIAAISCVAFFILVPYKFMRVVSSSMEPTLSSKDLIMYNPFAELSRGDIIIFRSANDKDRILVKRVVGISGDVIEINESGVYINSELYIVGEVQSLKDCYNVPQGAVFVIGDNYEVSVDSRCWRDPYVKEEDILGVVLK